MLPPTLPSASDFRFHTNRRTRWSDEDNQHVVNNAVYLTLLEEARHDYFDSLGLLTNNQFPFVLAQTNIRFLAPGVGGANHRIDLRTTTLGTSSFIQVYRITDVNSDRILCEAEALLVAWDNTARSKTPMTSAFRNAIAEFEQLDGDSPQ